MMYEPDSKEEARRHYADCYAQEHFIRQKVEQTRQGRAAWFQLGWFPGGREFAEHLGIEYDVWGKYFDELGDIGEWLLAEAEWRKIRAEALLRSYGGFSG